MNGEEQKERSKALSDLRKRLDTMDSDFIALVVQEVNDRKKEDANILADIAVNARDENRKLLERTMQQRSYVDEQNRQHAALLVAFVSLPWWKRYVWMLFGVRNLQRVDRFGIEVRLWWNS